MHGWPVGLAVVAALLASAVAGVINGALVVLLEAESLVITLGSGTVISGLVLWISDSNTVGGVSAGLVDPVSSWELLGLPLAFYYALLLCLIVWYVMELTTTGRRLLFVGRGREVARLNGVRVHGCGSGRWSHRRLSAVSPASSMRGRSARPILPPERRSCCPRSRPPSWVRRPSCRGDSILWGQ